MRLEQPSRRGGRADWKRECRRRWRQCRGGAPSAFPRVFCLYWLDPYKVAELSRRIQLEKSSPRPSPHRNDSVGEKFALTPAQWLPKPATILLPHKRRTLRDPWSPRRGSLPSSASLICAFVSASGKRRKSGREKSASSPLPSPPGE